MLRSILFYVLLAIAAALIVAGASNPDGFEFNIGVLIVIVMYLAEGWRKP